MLISICIPTYNRAHRLEQCLSSILSVIQIRDDVEVIVSDNCSPDNTKDVVQSFSGKMNIKYSRNENNLGFAGNFLKLFELASGKYLFFISDEDSLLDGFLKVIELCNSKADYLLSGVSKPDGTIYYHYENMINQQLSDYLKYSIFGHSYLSGLCVKKSDLYGKIKALLFEYPHLAMYPHEILVLMLLSGTFSSTVEMSICQGVSDRNNSISRDEGHLFYMPPNRIMLFKEIILFLQKRGHSHRLVRKVSRLLGKKFISTLFHTRVLREFKKSSFPLVIKVAVDFKIPSIIGLYIYRKIRLLVKKK